MKTILIVDDEPNLRKILSAFLSRDGHHVVVTSDGQQALNLLAAGNNEVHLVITDLRMPVMDGIALLGAVQENWPWLPVVILTAHGTVDRAVEAMKLGAFDFITKPFEQSELKMIVDKALKAGEIAATEPTTDGYQGNGSIVGDDDEQSEDSVTGSLLRTGVREKAQAGTGAEAEAKTIEMADGAGAAGDSHPQPHSQSRQVTRRTGKKVPTRFGLIGSSTPMLGIYNIIDRVANTPSTVLITGESGTGKELVARALHENSSRSGRPFIKVHCAAIPKNLMESELFGYEKGAFTGAVTSKPGRFELADTGTLFLDEIGEIPVEMQVKLLRALQESEFERVGGIKTIKVNVRIISATNRDLAAEVEKGNFRDDLFYRLNVVPIGLPPLRERPGDIPDLVSSSIIRFNKRLGRSIKGISPQALSAMVKYHWPGNVRELENVIERTILFSDGEELQFADLPEVFRKPLGEDGEGRGRGGGGGSDSLVESTISQVERVLTQRSQQAMDSGLGKGGLKDFVRETTNKLERELILKALDQTGWNVTRAAQNLKLSRKGLQNKMKELGLRDGGEE